MTKTDPLTIAMIGLVDLEDETIYRYDPMLYHAFMLMSSSLAKATYYTDKFGIDTTTPLTFNFTDQSLIFCKHPTQSDIVKLVNDHLLPTSDGVIVNLGAMGVKGNNPTQSLFREIIQKVYESRLPTVFTDKSAVIVTKGWTPKLIKAVLEPPASTVASITKIFPRRAPVLGYDYGWPSSLQIILTTLITEIEKHA
ncbi:MAG: hypothetical protein GY796_05415 [Chloroflexi bacterium]|nr:hypothetical protein [Chloroflexota bacterium]